MSLQQEAIEKARAAAQAKREAAANQTTTTTAEPNTGEAVVLNQSQAVAAATTALPAQRLTRQDLGGARLSVESYLKIDYDGIKMVADSKTRVEKFVALLDMRVGKGILFLETIKFGNPVQYVSTADRVTADNGKSWATVLQTAEAVQPGVQPYSSGKLALKLVEDCGGARAGAVVGISLSTTNWDDFILFYDEVCEMGLGAETIKIMVTHKPRVNNKGKWGTFEFALYDETVQGNAKAAAA